MFLSYVLLLIITGINSISCNHRTKRIVGGIPAAVAPADEPIVYVRFTGKAARVEGVRTPYYYSFTGLRYAHPPTGKDRFLRPREVFLQGSIDATKLPPPCMQPLPGQNNKTVGSEDCLFLNIFTPELPTGTEGLPVVIWIHGGGFRYGSASQYGVRHLIGKRLVVVSIQYRLGSLGFLSTGTKEMPGNVALWDMALATQFVRNYVGFFGGNPYRIVVMGHDTGASSALLVALSNIAKGIPSAVVAMSGTAVSHWAMDNTPTNTAREVAEQNGCITSSFVVMVKCLQNLPADSIIRGDSQIAFTRMQSRGFLSGLSGDLGCAPVAEGYNDGRSLPGIIQGDPMSDLYKQKQPQIPLLTGITKDETKRAVKGKYREEIINKLKIIPDFLDKVLVKNLQSFIGIHRLTGTNGTQKTSGSFLPFVNTSLFQNYIHAKALDYKEGLERISEATGDALFNVPAFLTADLWAKRGVPTFLYRFDHCGKRKKGHVLLSGLPLVDSNTSAEMNDVVSHGDELSYLFDVHDIHGESLETNGPVSEEDDKVRDIFTQMIADFAKNGKLTLENREVRSFSSAANNFIQIKPKPALSNNFRFCEMALWCGITERLKSQSCQFFRALDTQIHQQVEDVNKQLNKAKNYLTNDPVQSVSKLNEDIRKNNPLNSLLSGSKKSPQGNINNNPFRIIG